MNSGGASCSWVRLCGAIEVGQSTEEQEIRMRVHTKNIGQKLRKNESNTLILSLKKFYIVSYATFLNIDLLFLNMYILNIP